MKKVSTPRRVASTTVCLCTFVLSSSATLAVCPFGAFDGGVADATSDVLLLRRYALNISDASLLANTRYAKIAGLTAAQITSTIDNASCAIDVNGDNQIDEVDIAIVARYLAGFRGGALTDGLNLGAGARPTSIAVQSYLAAGCIVNTVPVLFAPLPGPATTRSTSHDVLGTP